MKDKTRFIYETRPLAYDGNIVSGSKYRFTVLTPSLIRMEYSEHGVFEDRASQFAFFRDFPENNFVIKSTGGLLRIETANLIVTYRENETFSEDSLSVKLKIEPASTWHFGERFEDLGGTARTLDRTNGPTPLDHGVCSRYGFSVMDDSDTVVLNDTGWVETRKAGSLDFYFWGYGFQYKDAIKDFYRLTGAPPLLPAYALGNWWSRYHAYTQEEYQELIKRFERENIPFSVSVVDMDWHITKIPEELKEEDARFTNGWTGYTWNEELFPDYKAFLKFLKDHNLKTSLNLHPAQGVGCHEEMYEEMALACGIDPQTKERVKLDLLSPDFMEHYFDILHHPYEEDGVDFWWMDWQQGTDYWWIHDPNKDGHLQDEREVTDPLWFLNHLHIIDIKRNGKRPMFFSRYSGPGSHRYPIGFSGDTLITWDALDFQPYFTATASNVGYTWWSHDIGGHMRSCLDNELMVRWVQLGVFSPVNRLHSNNSSFAGKEPWNFEEKTEGILKDWLRFRHKLFPYIYTMNYRNTMELEPMIQPMYYNYPKRSGAYEAKNQFFFGSELMVAPITRPNNRLTDLSSVEVWFPEGDWFDFFTGLHYTSNAGRKLTVARRIQDYPVFAKAGAIVPMQASYDLKAGNDLEVVIFPGKGNSFTLYEDAGDGSAYENGEYVQTKMHLTWSDAPVFTLEPAMGALSLLPEKRNYRLVFRGFQKEVSLKVFVDHKETAATVSYDESTRAFIVNVSADVTSVIQVQLAGSTLITDNGDEEARCRALLQKMPLEFSLKSLAMKIITTEESELQITLVSKFTRKISKLYNNLARGVEYNVLIDALKEQLMLIDGDYVI